MPSSLSIGDKLGPYEILAPIGEGGMGEVWKARDSRLGRLVAIKISKTPFSPRFDREARAAAALSHPHICQLHDIGPNYLVMEYVQGSPLKGPLSPEKAAGYALQILDALEALHKSGIAHRDLKPSNILVTTQGVKLLDFGLALFMPESLGPDAPTQTQLTQAGALVGTPAYMAPELWEGKTADVRSDVYAFGCVLYETVTGKRCTKDFTPTRNPALDRVVKTCLEVDPDARYQRAADARRDLAWVLQKPRFTRGKWIGIAAAILAVAAILWARLSSAPPAATLQPLVRMDVDLGPRVSLGSVTGADEVLSPDGRRLVYVSRGKLWSRTLDQAEATELAGTDGAFAPFFSPDNRWVGFFAQGKLKKISVDGSGEVDLCAAPAARGGSWGDDGNIIATLSVPGALSRIPSAGGAPTAITMLDQSHGEVTQRWPQLLPGGKAVLFTSHTTTGAYDGASIMAVSLANHRAKTLLSGGTFGRYIAAPSGAGYLLYVKRATLFAVRFDPDRLEIHGTPTPVLDQVAYNPGSGSAQFGISANGALVYRIGGSSNRLVNVQWMEPSGSLQPLLVKPGFYERPSLSPDGSRLGMEVTDGSNSDLWIYEPRRDAMTRLTNGLGGDPGPVWSPDGRYLVFDSPNGTMWTRADGSSQPRPLTGSKSVQQPWSFSPDGARLALMQATSSGEYHIWTVEVSISEAGIQAGPASPFVQTTYDERHPSFSPDGKMLAYSSNESGSFQIYVRKFPDDGRRWQVSSSGGVYPEWSGGANELFFRTEDNRIMVAGYSVKGGEFVPEKPREWSAQPIADLGLNMNFTVARDGKRVAALMPVELPEEQAAHHHVVFLMNFTDELRRRLP